MESLSELIAQKMFERLLHCHFKMMSDHPQTADEVVNSAAVQQSAEEHESFIFTKKSHRENKFPAIVQALQKSIIGRNDKTRAFVQELRSWQKDGYIDSNYNAQVMYDELAKIVPVPFGYEVFKKHYNNTRN